MRGEVDLKIILHMVSGKTITLNDEISVSSFIEILNTDGSFKKTAIVANDKNGLTNDIIYTNNIETIQFVR
jgi:hypothetical protein